MTTTIKITLHASGQPVGTVTINESLTEKQVGEVVKESGGFADLVGMGDWDGAEDYEWTGDEVYEIVARADDVNAQTEDRETLIAAIEAADLSCPEQVTDFVLDALAQRGMQAARDELDRAIANDEDSAQ